MPEKKISQLEPKESVYSDDLFVIARGDENRKITLNDMNIINIAYNDLADLKNGTNNNGNNQKLRKLIKGQWYYIIDRLVYIRALSDHELLKDAVYRKKSASKGSITLISGTQGNINSITVNGVNILGAPVYYFDIDVAVHEMQEAINFSSTTHHYKAIARPGGVLEIYSLELKGTSINGYVVSGTVSNNPGDDVVLGSAVAMQGKEELLPIKYDFNNDEISGIEHIGFTGTQLFADQVGFQTELTETSEGYTFIQKTIEIGQQIVLEGLLKGFREDYKESYAAKFYITCWRSETEFYIINFDIDIWKPVIDLNYATAGSAASLRRPAYSEFNVDPDVPNTIKYTGAGNQLAASSSLNGWALSLSAGDNQILVAVGNGPWSEFQGENPFIVDNNYKTNWLFSSTCTILNNNF